MNHILLIDCTDHKGLIFKISNVLFKNDFNVVDMKEHVDQENNMFYMRCEFTGTGSADTIKKLILTQLPANASVSIHSKKKKDIIVFATKEHHCLVDILTRHYFGELNANIKCVVANHQDLRDIVLKFGVDFVCISHEFC